MSAQQEVVVNVMPPEQLAAVIRSAGEAVLLRLIREGNGRPRPLAGAWVDTGRRKSKTTVWRWSLRLRWGWLPWPTRHAAGGIVRPVLRYRWPR